MAYSQRETPKHPERRTASRVVLAASLIFVLLAISVSSGEVIYTAWIHDLKDGLFALLFAVLSTRAALSWCLWRHSCYQDPGLPKTREQGDTVS